MKIKLKNSMEKELIKLIEILINLILILINL